MAEGRGREEKGGGEATEGVKERKAGRGRERTRREAGGRAKAKGGGRGERRMERGVERGSWAEGKEGGRSDSEERGR